VKLPKYVSLKHNGQNVNFSFLKGKLFSNVTLAPGLNKFTLSVKSPCGEASADLTIVYDDCKPPIISLKVPSSNVIQSTNQKVQIIAKITNITSNGQITVLNGNTSIPFAFSNGIIKTQVMLIDGQNSITIRAKNPCGEDTENISISYEPCQTPQIIMNPSTPSMVMTSQVQLNAVIQNYAASTNVTITVNGHAIAPSNYQINNGNLSGMIPLNNGSNVISVYAVSPCGSDAKEFSILRCKNPSVNWINPALVNTVVTNEAFTLQVMANNALNASNIILTFNGIPLGFNYNVNTDALTANVNLVPGNNVFSLRISNTCGMTSSNITLIYQPGNNGSNGNNGGNNSNGNNGNNGSNGNNGHGNNGDGVDVSNPGQGGGGPNGQNDPSGNVDDENQQGNGSGNMGTNGNNGGQNNKSQTPTPSNAPKGNSGSNKNTTTPKANTPSGNKGSGVKSNKPSNSSKDKGAPSPKTPTKTNGKGKGR
jgi:hypothetical protein